MADNNENQNNIFGGVQFGGDNNVNADSTTFFEGTFQNNSNSVFSEWQTNSNVEANSNTEGVSSSQKAENVFGGWEKQNTNSENSTYKPVDKNKAITKQGLWSKIKAFLFQEIDLNAPIKIELTPYQQKVENEINDFLHQEITFKGIANFFKGKK